MIKKYWFEIETRSGRNLWFFSLYNPTDKEVEDTIADVRSRLAVLQPLCPPPLRAFCNSAPVFWKGYTDFNSVERTEISIRQFSTVKSCGCLACRV